MIESLPASRMTRRTLARIGMRLLLLQARWDPARMQGTGLSFALDPWLSVCWAAEPEGLRAARLRHLDYFNTHPIAAWLVVGIVCRHEAAAASVQGAEREALVSKIRAFKTGLGASLAGIYDSFFWGALRPASALAGLLTAQLAYRWGLPHPLAAGAAAALAVYNGPALAARWLGLTRGLKGGERAITDLARLPVKSWTQGLRWAAAGGALLSFALGAAGLDGPERMAAVLTFAAGIVLSWRLVAPLAQLGLAGLAGMAASVAGIWP